MTETRLWLPSLPRFIPRRFGLGAWTDHVPFAYWLMKEVRPEIFVELGVHTGESYFAFCQSVQEHALPTLCYAVDTWLGDAQAGFYGEEVFAECSEHNECFYRPFSYLVRARFDEAAAKFEDGSIGLLHIDGLHTYEAVRHDFETWLPKVRPGGLILLHDTAERTGDFGVWRLWEEISAQSASFSFLHGSGLGVLRKGDAAPGASPFLEALFTAQEEEAGAIRSHFVLWADYLKLKLRKRTNGLFLPPDPESEEARLQNAFANLEAQLTAQQWAARDYEATIQSLQVALAEAAEETAAVRGDEAARRRELAAALAEREEGERAHAAATRRLEDALAGTERTQTEVVSALQMQLGEIETELTCRAEALSELPAWFDTLHAAAAKLYHSRRWKFANPVRAFRAKRSGSEPWASYWPLDRVLEGFTDWQRRHPFVGPNGRAPATSAGQDSAPAVDPYQIHIANNRITPPLRELLTRAARDFTYQPTISLLMPVYNVDPKWLQLAVESVRAQIYPRWELCLADDASTDERLREYLRRLEGDERIKIVFRPENGHISAASNSAAELATGEFIALLDNDDALAPHALFEIVRLLQREREADLIYSDEDKIDESGRRFEPHFKPDWSPELLLSYNYVNHLTCIRRSVFEEAGRFRVGFEGSQDHDLLLRVVSATARVHHIPKVLYHWRALPSSSATSARDKVGMHRNGRAAVEEYLQRLGARAQPYQPAFARELGLPINLLDWPDTGPSVAIIIPVRNQPHLLRNCLGSIKRKTTYADYRIVVVNNDSDDPEMHTYLKDVRAQGIEVRDCPNDADSFSYSRLNNRAVEAIPEELVLLLNNDTEVLEPKWLSRLVGYLSLPGVGAAGARLLYPDDTIQHAGIVLGMQNGRAPDHPFLRQPSARVSRHFLAEVARNCTAVTGACLLMRRQLFLELGGFDETNYRVSLNDVDMGLRLLERGYRTVYVAGAELRHHESASRGRRDDPAELEHFRRVYGGRVDRFYNPNFSDMESFQLDPGCHFDYAELLGSPPRVLMATHNLSLGEGAPKALYEIAKGVKERARIDPIILSPTPGGLGDLFERAGIPVRVQALDLRDPMNLLHGWASPSAYENSINRVRQLIEQEKPDVVVANTLHNFHVIEAAKRAGVPSVWIILESYTAEKMAAVFDEFALLRCERAFVDASRIVFVSTDTKNLYQRYQSQHNFCVLNNGLDPAAIDQYMARVSKEEARAQIGAPAGQKVITMVGTICARKDQGTLLEAARLLRAERRDFCCYLVGLREGDPYSREVKETLRQAGLDEIVKLIPETPQAYRYFRAADIFAFTSLVEGYSLAILEAEAFGLPLVCTPCAGVSEQMVHGRNGFLFEMGNAPWLADRLRTLLDDHALRTKMGKCSRQVFNSLPSYSEMLERYEREFSGLALLGRTQASNAEQS